MRTTYASDYSPIVFNQQPYQQNGEYNPRAMSVSNYAFRFDPNFRFRPNMEDAARIVDSFMGDPNQGYFAIFDGHGGSEAVDYCKNRFHTELQRSIQANRQNVLNAINTCFLRIDDQLRLAGAIQSGTTATIGYIRRENEYKVLYTANVGDSKAVIVGVNGFEVLTENHHGLNQNEINRVIQSGGIVSQGRVAGQLAITRALGDHHLKNCGVIATPYINRRVITPKDRFMVIASDGLWDVLNERDLLSVRTNSSQEIATELVTRAITGGSRDNVAVVVICFN